MDDQEEELYTYLGKTYSVLNRIRMVRLATKKPIPGILYVEKGKTGYLCVTEEDEFLSNFKLVHMDNKFKTKNRIGKKIIKLRKRDII